MPSVQNLGARCIPRTKLGNPNWVRVLQLLKPPQDGYYVSRAVVDPQSPKKVPHMTLLGFGKSLFEDSKQTKPNQNKQNKGPEGYLDWNSLNEDREALLLGFEQLKPNQRLAISGCGISGLSLAWFVSKARPDVSIDLYDAKQGPGGWIKSINSKGGSLFELGPRTLLPSNAGTTLLLQMLNSMGRLDEVCGVPKSAAANAKGLYYDGKMVKLPTNLFEAVKFLARHKILKGLRWSMLTEWFRPQRKAEVHDESVASFMSRRVNKLLDERMVSAVMRGIYASSSRDLSARSVARLNKLYYLEKIEHTSITGAMLSGSMGYLDNNVNDTLASLCASLIASDTDQLLPLTGGVDSSRYSVYAFPKGMQSLCEILAKDLEANPNVKFHYSTKIVKVIPQTSHVDLQLERKGALASANVFISTTADPDLFSYDKKTKELLGNINYTNVDLVNIATKEKVTPSWFGVLVPRSENAINKEKVLGIVFDSEVRNCLVPIVPGGETPPKCEGTIATVMSGGDLWTDSEASSARTRAIDGFNKIIGCKLDKDTDTHVSLHRSCIPRYDVGHSTNVQAIHERITHAYNNRVLLIGTAAGRGVGLSDCVVDAMLVATRFSQQRRLLHPEFFFGQWYTIFRSNLFA